MKHHLSIILLFAANALFAQAPAIEWQKTYGGISADLLKTAVLKSDGYIIGGFSKSPVSGDKTESHFSEDHNDYWVLSVDFSGNIIWQRALQASNPAALMADYPMALRFFDDQYFLAASYDDFDIIMMQVKRFSANGTGILNAYPNFESDCVFFYDTIMDSIIVDYFKTSGGNYVTAATNSLFSANCEGFADYMLTIKSGSDVPETLWNEFYSGSGYDELTATIECQDGGFLLTGFSNSPVSADKTENSNGGFDFWIVKTDSDGTILWQNTIGGNANDSPANVIQTADGGYLIGGSSESGISGDKSEASKGGFDYWLVKLSADGEIDWQKTIGGNQNDKLAKIKDLTTGGYIICGTSDSTISGDKTGPSRGLNDIWLVRINADGEILWDKTIGGNLDDVSYDIVETVDGGLLVMSSSASSISGDKSESSKGDTDYWLLKLAPEALSVLPHQQSFAAVSPNPTSEAVAVTFTEHQANVRLTLTNVLGQPVSSREFSAVDDAVLEITGEKGIYFLTIEGRSQNQTIKIVKK